MDANEYFFPRNFECHICGELFSGCPSGSFVGMGVRKFTCEECLKQQTLDDFKRAIETFKTFTDGEGKPFGDA